MATQIFFFSRFQPQLKDNLFLKTLPFQVYFLSDVVTLNSESRMFFFFSLAGTGLNCISQHDHLYSFSLHDRPPLSSRGRQHFSLPVFLSSSKSILYLVSRYFFAESIVSVSRYIFESILQYSDFDLGGKKVRRKPFSLAAKRRDLLVNIYKGELKVT